MLGFLNWLMAWLVFDFAFLCFSLYSLSEALNLIEKEDECPISW